jgi:hypothetical protein
MNSGDYSGGDKEGPGIEVAFIDAPAPDAVMPFPIPGMDLNMFRNYWMRALAGDVDVPPAILMLVRQSRDGANNSKERSEQEWELLTQFAVAQRLREIDRLIDQYNQMADWHHEQAEKARAKMREAADKLTEIDEFVSGVDEVLREKEATGKFDREKAIELLKARGLVVDLNDDEKTLFTKLNNEQRKARAERSKWSQQYDDAKIDADYNDRMEREDREKARELVERRDAIRKHGYDAVEESRELTKVTDEYKPDVQRKAVEMEKAKSGNIDQTNEMRTRVQKRLDTSQANDEEVDFLASADDLTATFAAVSANTVSKTVEPTVIARDAPTPGPAPSV